MSWRRDNIAFATDAAFSSRYVGSRFNSHGKAIRPPGASRRQLAENATQCLAVLGNCSIQGELRFRHDIR